MTVPDHHPDVVTIARAFMVANNGCGVRDGEACPECWAKARIAVEALAAAAPAPVDNEFVSWVDLGTGSDTGSGPIWTSGPRPATAVAEASPALCPHGFPGAGGDCCRASARPASAEAHHSKKMVNPYAAAPPASAVPEERDEATSHPLVDGIPVMIGDTLVAPCPESGEIAMAWSEEHERFEDTFQVTSMHYDAIVYPGDDTPSGWTFGTDDTQFEYPASECSRLALAARPAPVTAAPTEGEG